MTSQRDVSTSLDQIHFKSAEDLNELKSEFVSCMMNLVSNPGRQQSKNARLRPISAGGLCGLLLIRQEVLKLPSEFMAGSPQLWTERPVHTTMSPRLWHSCHQGRKEIALEMAQVAKHLLSAMTTIQDTPSLKNILKETSTFGIL